MDVDDARTLAETFRHRVWEPTQDSRGEEFHMIEVTLNVFSLSFRIYADLGVPIPCMSDQGKVPAAVDPIGVGFEVPPSEAGIHSLNQAQEGVRDVLGDLAKRSGMDYDEYKPSDALDFVVDRLADFLSARPNGGDSAEVAGQDLSSLPFVVHSQRRGLAIHYTPAYVITNPLYFNAPTTPVVGRITPGLWKFAGVGPGVPMTFDPGIFDAKVGNATLTAI